MENELLKEKYEDFHKNADVQKRVIEKDNFTYKTILSLIDKYLKPSMKVLDVGCGVGTISLYIANKGNEVMGTDISELAINATTKSAEILGIGNVSFKAINFLDAEFKEKFDFVILNAVLEHLQDERTALKKIHELLNPKGILFISVPSERDFLHRIRMAVNKRDSFDEKLGHLRRYGENSLSSLLRENGFDIMAIQAKGGIIREFLYYTSIGNKLVPYASASLIKNTITQLDNLSAKIFGAYEIYAVAKKTQKIT